MPIEEIENKIKKVKNKKLDYAPNFAQTQSRIIELIDFYWASKFRDHPKDKNGYKKAFYNIVNNPVETAAKMMDIDTKDLRLTAKDGNDYWKAWLMEKDFKRWMKKQKLGRFLNDIVFTLPKYGHLVLKKVKDKIFKVWLQNFYVEPDANSLDNSLWIIEEHDFTPGQLETTGKNKGWDNIDKVIYYYNKQKKKDEHIKVYEHYEKGDYQITADVEDGIILAEDSDKEMPYKELCWDKLPGRWIGRGQVERLFENQIAINQNENLLRAGLRYTSKHTYQTRDTNVPSNLMTDVDNGDLMIVQSEITPIATEERNLSTYQAADQKWASNTEQNTFSYDAVRGKRAPAGTPLGSSMLQSQMAGSFFEFKKEDLSLFFKEVFEDWFIPEFKKRAKNDNVLNTDTLSSDEIKKVKKAFINHKYNNQLTDMMRDKGFVPNNQQLEVMKMGITSQVNSENNIGIPDDFYKDIETDVELLISTDQIDTASRMTTLQTALQIVGSNPTILEDPRTKKLFYQLMDLSGLDPTDFEIEEEEKNVSQMTKPNETAPTAGSGAQRGGSLARVPSIQGPQRTTQQVRA